MSEATKVAAGDRAKDLANPYNFMGKSTDSNLRMLMNILSSGGFFYTGQAADKTIRASSKYGENASEEKLVAAIQARMSKESAADARLPAEEERPTGDLCK